jgi:class 3 adenylate cyclase
VTTYSASLDRVIKAPRSLVWAVVSDTNRWDRAAGLAPARYEWLKEGSRNLRLAKAKELGLELEWIEPPYQWIEGAMVEGLRRFRKGPLSAGGFRVTLEDAPGGATLVKAYAYVESGWLVGQMQRFKFASALDRYLGGIATILEGSAGAKATLDEPAVVQARRLLAGGYDEATSGPRTPADTAQLEARATRMRERPVKKELVDRVIAFLRDRPDEEVSQIRPFELARTWGVDRREMLRAFLYATEVGLTDLSWQVNCPVCRVGASVIETLGELGQKSHCGACEIDYEVDFAQHVEAVFPVSSAVRRVSASLYCASSPAFLPHVLAQLRVDPGASATHAMELPAGSLHLRTLWTRRTADVELETRPAKLVVTVGAEHIATAASGSTDGKTEVVVKNESSEEIALLFERSAWSADAVLGTAIASMPEFANLFATEAPAAGVELKVGHVALLFSDLTGSTALYEKVGDAKAFAIVEDHFRICEAEIARHGGAIVKTMGDAVMASFATLDEAAKAALAMIRAHDAKYQPMGLGVKIGIHAGPSLMVRANERLDYFGTTVNVTARLQAQAAASEVVLMAESARSPLLRPIFADLPERTFEAHLKGIKETQHLVGVEAVEVSVDRSGVVHVEDTTRAKSQ